MKNLRCISALLIVLPLTNVAIQGSASELRGIDTEGEVSFIPNNRDPIEVRPPVPSPDVVIPPIGQTGPLTIAYVPNLNFGVREISNQDVYYAMVAEQHQLAGTEGKEGLVPYVSFAQVQDLRGSNAGWTLQVSLSSFESGTQHNELRGVQVYFASHWLDYASGLQQNAPTPHEDGLRLDANGMAQAIMTADRGQGAGVSSVAWGEQELLDAQHHANVPVVENDAIRLFVPGDSAKDAARYVATLTWRLTTTTTQTGETVPTAQADET